MDWITNFLNLMSRFLDACVAAVSAACVVLMLFGVWALFIVVTKWAWNLGG